MYSDSLVQITAESLVLNDYYFPGVAKTIPLEDLIKVRVLPPGLMTGQWRIWGMGFQPVWFAMDWSRPWRDAIFVAFIQDATLAAGFTAESSSEVIRALEERKVEVEIVE
jgi:hypothetical protein